MLYTGRYTVAGPGLDNFTFPAGQTLITVGDSHGQNGALRDLLAGFGRMPTPGKRRTLVFLGDFIDRGPDSLGCLNTAMHDAADLAQADEVVFLPGNHELMLADTLEAVAAGPEAAKAAKGAELWMLNGGMAFLIEAFEAAGEEMPKDAYAAVARFADMLPHPGHAGFAEMVRSWPSHFRMGDALCVHAGIAPKHPQDFTLGRTQDCHLVAGTHWAWIRDPFLSWQNGWTRDGAPGGNGCLVLHGHTMPSRAVPRNLEHGEDIREIFCRMTTNARICLDGGAAIGTGVAGAMMTEDGIRLAHALA